MHDFPHIETEDRNRGTLTFDRPVWLALSRSRPRGAASLRLVAPGVAGSSWIDESFQYPTIAAGAPWLEILANLARLGLIGRLLRIVKRGPPLRVAGIRLRADFRLIGSRTLD
jgi:hypothetical protein